MDPRIDYIELPGGDDLAAIKSFYGQVFGWHFTDYGPGYTAFSRDSAGLDGGFDASVSSAPPGPLLVLYAGDLEAMLDRVAAAGGTIVKPVFDFPGGLRFHFRDPAGNELAVWSDQPGS